MKLVKSHNQQANFSGKYNVINISFFMLLNNRPGFIRLTILYSVCCCATICLVIPLKKVSY